MWTYLVVLTTLGLGGPYTRPIYLWLLLSVLVLSIGALVSLAVEIKKGGVLMAHPDALDAPTATTEALIGPMTNARARAIRTGKYSGLVLVAMLSGYGLHYGQQRHAYTDGYRAGYTTAEQDFNHARYHYDNVRVEARYSDNRFLLHPARMDAWSMTTCTSQDWQPGETMKHLDFQWTSACSHVDGRGSFEFYKDAEGRRVRLPEGVTNVGY